MNANLPTGTVTFLMTDVEGSTARWEAEPRAMALAMERHDQLAEERIEAHSGRLLKRRGEGDALFAVFSRATDAAEAALALQLAYQQEPWPTSVGLKVRVALHTGETVQRDGDYYGPVVNRCARIRGIGHGGQILVSEAVANLVRERLPAEARLVDLGTHRLKDLSRPERVSRLSHPELPSEFAPLRSLDATPHNLPVFLTHFIGREEEIRRAAALLAGCRLLTLIGVGGVGKTRLAVQVGAERIEEFTDGVWFVDLSPVVDSQLIVPAFLGALGLSLTGPAEALPMLADHLRRRRLLIIVDNCEHLVREVAQVLNELLRQAPDLHVLATSRQPLNLSGECLYNVPAMQLPDPSADSEAALLRSDAGRLFLDRARQSQPNLVVGPESARCIAGVCRRLDGIPLALELAAARMRSLGPVQLQARIGAALDLLTGGSPNLPERHRRLRATLDWSYSLLSSEERAYLAAVAVFEGSWTLEAAEEVCGGIVVPRSNVLSLNEALVDRSLVVVDDDFSGVLRYRMLETVRAYAQSHLEAMPARAELEQSLVRWAIDLAGRERELSSAEQRTAWATEVDREIENIRAAVRIGLERGPEDPSALVLLTELHSYWLSRGRFAEVERNTIEALARFQSVDLLVRARALTLLGVSQMMQGRYDQAVDTFTEALRLRREMSDPRGLAAALSNLGIVERMRGNPGAARDAFAQAVSSFRQTEDDWSLAYALLNLACAEVDLRDYHAAEEAFCESEKLLTQQDDSMALAFLRVGIAELRVSQGSWAEAARETQRAIVLALEVRVVVPLLNALILCARTLVGRGEYRRAGVLSAFARKGFLSAGTAPAPYQVPAWESLDRDVEEHLGDALRYAIAEGQSMSLEEAANFAIAALSRLDT